MLIGVALAVVGLLTGFVTGGLVYRQSRRWCRHCGAGLVCMICTETPYHRAVSHRA